MTTSCVPIDSIQQGDTAKQKPLGPNDALQNPHGRRLPIKRLLNDLYFNTVGDGNSGGVERFWQMDVYVSISTTIDTCTTDRFRQD